MAQYRKLKIYQNQAREYAYVRVPEIRLQGYWLKDLGFEIGQGIEVKQQKHKLTITLRTKKK